MPAATQRRTPPVNATLTAIAHLETENVGGEEISTLVYDWEGTSSAYVLEQTKFGDGIEGGKIATDDLTTVVIPWALTNAEAPAFSFGYLLRYEQRGECNFTRVVNVESKPDLGFIRCITDAEQPVPDGEPDPCAP